MSKYFTINDLKTKQQAIDEAAAGKVYFTEDAAHNPQGIVYKGKIYGREDVTKGYLNTTDGKFYKESSFTNVLFADADKLYIELATNKIYRYTGSIYTPVSGVEYSAGNGISIINNTIRVSTFTVDASDNATFIGDVINSDGDKLSDKIEIGDVTGNFAPLVDGKVPAANLPSYVDDVIELLDLTATPPATCVTGDKYFNTLTNKIYTATGTDTWGVEGADPEKGKIYVNLSNNKTYRWGGSSMVEISSSLVIGTTAGTAFEGSRGLQCENDIDTLETEMTGKQATLISGTNIKTINNTSILGEGNISISTSLLWDE